MYKRKISPGFDYTPMAFNSLSANMFGEYIELLRNPRIRTIGMVSSVYDHDFYTEESRYLAAAQKVATHIPCTIYNRSQFNGFF